MRRIRMIEKRRAVSLMATLVVSASICGLSGLASAQAPGVEIVRDKGEQFAMLVEKANKLMEEKALLSLEEVQKQLSRKSCSVELPQPHTKKLTDREIWERSQAAHVRVGWHYRCGKCEKWHQNLAGGYFLNANGVAATCYHVIEKDKDAYKEGYLVAANDKGDLFPVTEVLAADAASDVAIIQVKVDSEVTPLPLNSNTYPGDSAWCYSDPLGRSGYFSKGIVNRFYVYKKEGREESARMEVSTDWAPGSSGAAVLDECGNAIGHVSEITSAGTGKKPSVVVKRAPESLKDEKISKPDEADDDENSSEDKPDAKKKEKVSMDKSELDKMVKALSKSDQAVIVFHCASRAADLLSLVNKKSAPEESNQ